MVFINSDSCGEIMTYLAILLQISVTEMQIIYECLCFT
jgi:hypothetical protein